MIYKSATFYDSIYVDRDYAGETEQLHKFVQKHKVSPGNKLLDVACGTGQHLFFLQQNYVIEGLDINPEFVEIAQRKLPSAKIHTLDMMNFRLNHRFDVITCLFSSIGYVLTYDRLASTLSNMANHLNEGGVLVIEPWYTPTTYKPGHFTATIQEFPHGKVARVNHWSQQNDHALGDSQFLIAGMNGIQHLAEKHELGLFSIEQYKQAFTENGMNVWHDEHGLIGRGLFIGVR